MLMQRIERRLPRPSESKRVLGYRAVQVLAFVNTMIEVEGRAPSYGMICNELDMDRGNVSRLVARLEKRGLLSRAGSGRVRRIRLV